MNYSSQLAVAESVARKAGAFLKENFHRPKKVDALLPNDIKLRLDKETQKLIEKELSAAYPSYSILGEEGGLGMSESTWIVDPLDGTVNYYYGIPIFCVSIALRVKDKLTLGCVYDPMQDECFCALAGGEAFLNGKKIIVSSRDEMSEAVVFIGHGRHDRSGEEGLRRFAHVSRQVRKIRILGSAAISLCYIAAGRFDAYVENSINLWDFAAAKVILEAAGGRLEFAPAEERGIVGSVTAWNGRLPLLAAISA